MATKPGTHALPVSSRGQVIGKEIWQSARPILVVFAVWELVGRSGIVHQALFPPFSAVVLRLYELGARGLLFVDLAWSLYRLAVGVALGILIGTAFGILMGASKKIEVWMLPVLDFFLSIPGVAIYPVVVLLFGLSNKAIIVTLAFEAALTVMMNTWTGVRSVPRILIDAARSMGASLRTLFYRVMLPGSLAFIVTGYRLAFTRAWRILVATELMGGLGYGLGFRIQQGRQFFDAALVLAGVLVIAVIGVVTERTLLRWVEARTVERWGTVT
jgi:ABC-type nitrate/sulfonate/bicarbonate transport system permease component